MSGVKRHHDGTSKPKPKPTSTSSSNSPFMPMFETFRAELDEHHDRRERIIKASRDITASSKKIIFSLQRAQHLHSPLPPKIAAETTDRLTGIQTLFTSIVPDLTGINAWRYQRQISGGLQEFMEAISFSHYLTEQKLMSLSQAQALLPEGVQLEGDDYVLGIFDLVGEIMRFGVTGMAIGGRVVGEDTEMGDGDGDVGEERTIVNDVRVLRRAFEGLDTTRCGGTGLGKDVEKKMGVMRTCVEKVEWAVYGMIVRGRERPEGWVMDAPDEGGRGEVESC